MSKQILSSGLGLILWMAGSWFFYLGYSSDLVAIAMILVPILAINAPRLNQQPRKGDWHSMAITVCYVGLGVGLYDVVDGFGGLSYFAGAIFGHPIVMVTTNAIFVLNLNSKILSASHQKSSAESVEARAT